MTDPNPIPASEGVDPETSSTAGKDRVRPLDVDGVNAAAIGTAAFTVGLVALLVFRGRLVDNDATWWLWVFFAGTIMGLVGIWYATRRRAAYRAAGRQTR
ncbi:MAG: DUF2530 domain-containing protein [Actinomycetes bacterium]